MKKIKLFTVFVFFAIASCNKTKVNPPGRTQNSDTKHEQKQVEEKTYHLSPEQISSSIRFLTSKSESNQSNAKQFNPESNLDPEYSIFVIEAALNSEFDQDPKDHDVFDETVEFNAPLTFVNGDPFVSPADLINAYDQFKSSIKQMSIGQKKVKIIDITATIYPAAGQITYKGSVVLFAGVKGKPTCAPYDATDWGYTFSPYQTGYCTGPVNPSAPNMVTAKLNNCYKFIIPCPATYSWINVSKKEFYTVTTGCASQHTPLWMSFMWGVSVSQVYQVPGLVNVMQPGTNNSVPCSYVLNGNQLNSYISLCNSISASNASGKYVYNQQVKAWHDGAGTACSYYEEWGWRLETFYADLLCNGNQ